MSKKDWIDQLRSY